MISRRPYAYVSIVVCTLGLVAGCGSSAQTATPTTTATATTSARTKSVSKPPVPQEDAARYAETGGYYFVSPSGTWGCAIIGGSYEGSPGARAGCQTTTGKFPFAVPDVERIGTQAPADAIQVGGGEGPRFGRYEQAAFWIGGSPANPATVVLGYGTELKADGLTCNTQPTGVSCKADESGDGFTVSTEGYKFEYTPVR